MKQSKRQGKTVLITGGGNGIGLATVRRLLNEGYEVTAWDLNTTELKTVSGDSTYLSFRELDLLDRTAVLSAAGDILETGGIDILINNAGVLVPGDFHEQHPDQWEFMLNVNLNASIFVTSLFLPSMYEKNSGHIINISSAAGLLGVPGLASYCASKFGIFGFTEALRHEAKNLGKTGVRFTTVHPNFLRTGMFEGARIKGLGDLIVPRVRDHETIADTIVEMAIKRRKILLHRPKTVRLTQFLRGILPYRVFLSLIRILGVHKGMSSHTGHTAGAAKKTKTEEPSE